MYWFFKKFYKDYVIVFENNSNDNYYRYVIRESIMKILE